MSGLSLDAYLYFHGDCREAMEFYRGVFGGELQLFAYGDSPGTDPDKRDWIMHADLRGAVTLLASDSENASPKSAKVELSLGGTDEARMRETFEALAAGGRVTMPLERQFWGDVYGKLTDRFGVDWAMNIGASAG